MPGGAGVSLFIFRPREGSGGPANRLIEIGKGRTGGGARKKKGGTDFLLPSAPFFPSLFLAPLPPSQTLVWLVTQSSQKSVCEEDYSPDYACYEGSLLGSSRLIAEPTSFRRGPWEWGCRGETKRTGTRDEPLRTSAWEANISQARYINKRLKTGQPIQGPKAICFCRQAISSISNERTFFFNHQ